MRTLVLNAGYEPLAIVSFRRALVLVLNHKATIIEADAEHPVTGADASYERPLVIVLGRYVRMPRTRRVPVTRRGVLRRDAFTCAYCGLPANTIDHVLPRSRGGAGSWENLVACCTRCNNQKADRTPREMGWSLSWAPVPPRGATWTMRGADRALPSWEQYLEQAA
ncbi:HNH endonuclease [Mycetocola spongiae]|uniref:HNH endonuclease n=1 Tax=Mycetocola spongiae TaxID=2859226 RepID=UPI001CF28418|nr:HNH endonuclease [Mycetocola spongiae]UCR88799.1 HNH endonuclease [Mycetocola spongiae]